MYRLRDLLIAVPALLLLSPLLLLIILGLWLSQGRVFFFQQRPGRYERPFTLIKFSTLYDAAPGADEYADQQARLTPLGRHLRRFSLDELPQLLNVIRGDMSLVGPRPLLMAYLPLYTEAERRRHEVPPGITGWAQIHGRNDLPFKTRFQYDLWYVDHRSLRLDWLILWRTLRQVLIGRGVYADAHTTSPPFDGTN
ncbi:MAG: sugar transferase [Bacteroidetes bacterium]|nr:MAG: sugar transferase [Bacteroidota bacterium]